MFDLCHFDLLKRGCANSVVGLELVEHSLHSLWGSGPKEASEISLAKLAWRKSVRSWTGRASLSNPDQVSEFRKWGHRNGVASFSFHFPFFSVLAFFLLLVCSLPFHFQEDKKRGDTLKGFASPPSATPFARPLLRNPEKLSRTTRNRQRYPDQAS